MYLSVENGTYDLRSTSVSKHFPTKLISYFRPHELHILIKLIIISKNANK